MLWLSLCFLLLWVDADAEKFKNPIAPNSPDPWMQFYKGYYYLIATSRSSSTNKVGIRRARTLSGLHNAEYETLYTSDGFEVWAPELHFFEGKWYLFYCACPSGVTSNCQHNIYVAESASDDIMGPYTLKADLQDPDNVAVELDPSYIMIDGDQYLLGSYLTNVATLFIRPMVNPYTPKGPRRFLSAPTYDWEKRPWGTNVGPEPLYHDGKIFVVFSASHCSSPDYNMGLLEFTGTDPLDSTHWTKYSKPVFQRNDTNHVYGPGHGVFFKSPDGTEDWMVYHGNEKETQGRNEERTARAQMFSWTKYSKPVFQSNDTNHVYGPGHSVSFKSPDGTEDWMVYHGNEKETQGCNDEKTARAQMFSWGEDGLPDFGTPVPLGVSYEGPSRWEIDRL